MLSQQRSEISSEDDDDYELPSLSERIKALSMIHNKNISCHVSSDSENEDAGLLKFSERIQRNSCSEMKLKEVSYKGTDEPKILKDVQKNNPPSLNIKLDFSLTSESEDEESEFLNFSQRIQSISQVSSTPKPIEHCYITSESDSDDELFSNLSERLSLMTPRDENKENYNTAVETNAKKISEFHTPLSSQKKVSYKAVDSESDESFSNFVEILRTPMCVNRKISHKVVDSESDDSFSTFAEKLRTPLSVNRKIQCKMNDTDSDDLLVNSLRKQVFKTPRSQKKTQKDAVLIPKIIETKHKSPFLVQDTPNSLKISKSENEKEFKVLFQPENINATFLQKRESCTRMLYDFYNRKVFNSQLPPDMPLIYDGSLKTTAGMCCSSVKNGTYVCSIKLSSSLLNSFDYLRDTLLHEMCHAAVWIINKQHKVRHGPLWQIWASRCKLILPFIECPRRCHNFEIAYNVWYQCPKCQWKEGRCKRVRKYHGALCKRCQTPIIMTHA